jgi:hypothetical protein
MATQFALLATSAFGAAAAAAQSLPAPAATMPAASPSAPAASAAPAAAPDPTPASAAPVAAAPGAVSPNAVPIVGAIAIVPLAGPAGQAPTVTGALEVTGGNAIIAASGAVTSADATTDVTLPRRGVLHVCASTTVKLAADKSTPADETPGLLMALDHGALEADFTTGRNSDMVLTPDFRILISGPGTANLKLRLAGQGDTCIDNAGVNAPYVLVTSLFGDGMYRVQPGQRVMFEHGSVHDVVDQEKEPCGCPPAVKPGSNEFPLAQSEGLAPLARVAPAPPPPKNAETASATLPLVYNSAEHAPQPAPAAPAATAPALSTGSPAAEKPRPKRGFFRSIGHFFRVMFGAD